MFKYIALALAATATAIPAGAPETGLMNGEFKTYMTGTKGGELVLNAIKNGTSEDFLIAGLRPNVYNGTPTGTQRNFEDPGERVSFHIHGEKYGWVITDVGHVDGSIHPVVARKGYAEDFKFHTGAKNHVITHDLTATTNGFYACERTVNGGTQMVLAWGNPNHDGSAPKGCKRTKVTQGPVTN